MHVFFPTMMTCKQISGMMPMLFEDFILVALFGERFHRTILRSLFAALFFPHMSESDPGMFKHKASGLEMAVKRFEGKGSAAARLLDCLKELSMGLYLNGSPQVSYLTDAFFLAHRGVLVYELHGRNLWRLLREQTLGPTHVNILTHQCLEGLQYLRNRDVIHFDLKPANILVKIRGEDLESTAPSEIATQIADFGISMKHELYDQAKTSSRWVQTHPYRCPEALLGSDVLSFSCDMWSMGCVMFAVADKGSTYFDPMHLYQEKGNEEQFREILRKRPFQMNCLTSLPNWQSFKLKLSTVSDNPALPPHIRAILGPRGIALLDAMLAPDPSKRILPEDALQHCFFGSKPEEEVATKHWDHDTIGAEMERANPHSHDTFMKLYKDPTNNDIFCGERAKWRMLQGTIQPNVLEWMQGDEFFQQSVEALKEREFHSFDDPVLEKNIGFSCRQLGCKIIISGGFGTPNSTRLHALRIDERFPVWRVGVWRDDFMRKNEQDWERLQSMLRARMEAVPKAKRGLNGNQVLTEDWHNWCLSGGNLFLTDAGGNLLEDDHVDGGRGVVHMGITLFGNRFLRCWNSQAKPKSASVKKAPGSKPEEAKVVGKFMDLHQGPGTVFLSCSSAFRHQVQHTLTEPDRLIQFGDLRGISVSIMIRSCLFSYARAAVAAGTPSPKCVFDATAEVFAEWQATTTLSFPTLEELQAAESKAAAAARTAQETKDKRKLGTIAKSLRRPAKAVKTKS